MHRTISLSEYVKKRNGVALGAPGSMSNMLKRSLGASSFNLFWQYWNPIWGYYLSRKIMKPLSQLFPIWLAIIMTFAVSGALHDLAITLVKWKFTFFFTPWFTLMSFIVLAWYFIPRASLADSSIDKHRTCSILFSFNSCC